MRSDWTAWKDFARLLAIVTDESGVGVLACRFGTELMAGCCRVDHCIGPCASGRFRACSRLMACSIPHSRRDRGMESSNPERREDRHQLVRVACQSSAAGALPSQSTNLSAFEKMQDDYALGGQSWACKTAEN